MKILIELHEDVELGDADAMCRIAMLKEKSIKSATILTPEQEEAKLKEAFEAGFGAGLQYAEIQPNTINVEFNDWRNRK